MKKILLGIILLFIVLVSNAQLSVKNGIAVGTTATGIVNLSNAEIKTLDGITTSSTIAAQLATKISNTALADPTNLIDSVSSIVTLLDKTDNYTLQFSGVFGSSTNDLGKIITVTASTAKVITVPTNAVAAFPTGSTITIIQGGSGDVSIAGSGVTFKSESSWVKIGAQESAIQLIKIATDTWRILGRLKA